MIHILFMILKALGILLLVLLFLVLLIVCTVLFLPFCYRAQVLKEEEGFACVKASGRVSWLFGAVALTASYEEQKPEAQILLFGASLETWKRRLKKIRRGEASVPRTEENETENALEAEKTAEQRALGAVEAYRKAGYVREEWPVIFGIDGLEEALEAVKAGEMQGSILNDRVDQAKEMAKMAVELFEGEDFEQESLKEGRYYFSEYQKVDGSNIDEYLNAEETISHSGM